MSKYIVGNGIQDFHYWRNNLQIRNEGTDMGEWTDSMERALWCGLKSVGISVNSCFNILLQF